MIGYFCSFSFIWKDCRSLSFSIKQLLDSLFMFPFPQLFYDCIILYKIGERHFGLLYLESVHMFTSQSPARHTCSPVWINKKKCVLPNFVLFSVFWWGKRVYEEKNCWFWRFSKEYFHNHHSIEGYLDNSSRLLPKFHCISSLYPFTI